MSRAGSLSPSPLSEGEERDVPETRFGVWFQGTALWRRYVLHDTLDVLQRLLPRADARFERILDAGCGCGLAFAELRARFAPRSLIGVDADGALIAAARADAGAALELRIGDVRHLDLPDASIDLALCHQTLHHVSQPERALTELRRVLAPGGVLLLAESCRPFLRMWWVRVFFRHPSSAYRDASDYVELVRRAGFALEPARIATPEFWWALPDLGLLRRFLPRGVARHPIVCLAATRPA
ncbi:MAG TPA: class I SAM-dependent methyltransferase [Myxococcota bacterium]|jgi:SAM-dependent methyltransferase